MRATLLPAGEKRSEWSVSREPPRESNDRVDTRADAPPIAKASARIEGYDWVRLLAAVNVVLFHVSPTPTGFLGRGGVPAFLMIAASIPAMRTELEAFGPLAAHRARRILVPWLFWSAVFGLVAGARYLHRGIVPEWTVHDLLIGTSMHLWFFPAVFVGTLLVWFVLRLIGPLSDSRGLVLIIGSGLGLFAIHAWLSKSGALSAPYGHWVFAAPALAIGMALGLGYRESNRRRRAILVIAVGLAAVLGAGLHWAIDEKGSAISYFLAGTALPATLLLPLRSGVVLQSFTRVSLGVYALHPLVYLGLQSFVGPRLNSVWIALPAVFLGAVAVAALIRLTRWGKALV
jgi:peptidoglycan/LPS O-acetylase OafA/YrhL